MNINLTAVGSLEMNFYLHLFWAKCKHLENDTTNKAMMFIIQTIWTNNN